MVEEHFEIKLPQFEGPFDLLLFFIERDELDIHEISIAKITDDFLDYLHHMQQLNMELASEFIYVAATLMRIKAKMLLPRYEVDENGNEVDLKADLIRKLIQYKKYKLICEELKPMEDERFKREKRGNIHMDMETVAGLATPGEELESFDLYKLMLVYNRVLTRYRSASKVVKHTVVQYPYTIEKQKEAIARLIEINKRLDFSEIKRNSTNKVHFVYNFLALLEMLQQELISIQIGIGFNNFWIAAREA